MGAAPVQQLSFALLDGDRNPSVEHINRTAGTGVDSLLITVASPVALHAFDSKGRHTGPIPIPNPAPKEVTGLEEGIPSGSLSSAGHNTYLGLAPDDRYRIELRGLAFGTFTLKLEEFLDDNPLSAVSYLDVPVSPTTRAHFTIQHVADASQLELDINGDGVTDFTLAPSPQPNTLASLRILTAMVRALRLRAGIENSLVSKLEAAASALQRGDRQAVAGVLGAFKNEVEAQKGKAIAATDASGLIGIANRLLTSV